MSFSDTFENDVLKLVFNGTPIANIADNAASSPLTSLYISLHVGDPGEGGNQATSEVNYPGYARVAIVRTASGWTVTGSSASPTATVEWPQMDSGTPSTATHAAIGTHPSGGGKIIIRGPLTPTIPINIGTIPRLRNTSTITLD